MSSPPLVFAFLAMVALALLLLTLLPLTRAGRRVYADLAADARAPLELQLLPVSRKLAWKGAPPPPPPQDQRPRWMPGRSILRAPRSRASPSRRDRHIWFDVTLEHPQTRIVFNWMQPGYQDKLRKIMVEEELPHFWAYGRLRPVQPRDADGDVMMEM
ncbi:hypothetical protein MPH_00646 [Macrophomina phaseolina MS6]|uniref:Uncharacterized protein n=1 Tax=Macrophomina phaseolina (strain MS6) TaxID=1126212 RepID=K2SZK1_MACPH|nr:hypothetical protein MPH_00646 [Macrophomina phaseolina MS6]